jgi:hypothetical protein
MCVSGITFIGYTKYRRNIGKQNELKVLESTTTKGHKQNSKYWLRSPMLERVLITLFNCSFEFTEYLNLGIFPRFQ